jgi:hypothetical protein
MKSAMAEESILSQILREPAMLQECKDLTPQMFSVSLLGNVYGQLSRRFKEGMEVSVAVLEDLSTEEMSHITGILQRQEGPVSQQAITDCIRIIKAEHQSAGVSSEDDLLAYQSRLKERKGIR